MQDDMHDDLQRDLEREIRKEARRDWAYRHRTALIVIALMIVAMGIGALVTYVTDDGGATGASDGSQAASEGVAATIDGQDIAEDAVTAYIRQYRGYAGYQEDGAWATFLDGMSSSPSAMREDAIKALARRVAVDKKAEETGTTVTDDEMDARIDEEAKEAGHAEDYEAYVTGTLMYPSMDDYRADVRMEILLDKLVSSDIDPIEPSELQMVIHASDSTESYIGSRTYDLVVPLPEDASPSDVTQAEDAIRGIRETLGDCKSTEDFLKGGTTEESEVKDRGWSCLSEPTAAYLEALQNLTPGSMSEPFRDRDGWHVVWCAETFSTRPDSSLSLSEMPEEIYRALKVDTMNALMDDEMSNYADNLLTEHDLKINPMPSGLPYDVDMDLSYYRKDEGTESTEELAQSGLDALEAAATGDDGTQATQEADSSTNGE